MESSPPSASPIAEGSRGVRDAEGARAPTLRRALFVAALRGGGALLGIAFWVFLGRRLGAVGSGQIRQGIALVMFSAAFLRFGLDNIVLREVAVLSRGRLLDTGDAFRDARALMQRVFLLILAVGLPLSGALAAGAETLATAWFDEPELAPVLAICAWACVPMAIVSVAGEAHKGAGRSGWGTFLQFDVRHLIFLPVAIAWIGVSGSSGTLHADATRTAAWILLASFVVAAALSIPGWVGRAASHSGRTVLPLRVALSQGSPLLQCALLLMSLQWLDTVLLGSFADSRSVGVYGAAVSAAMVMTFLLYGANAILAPRFAQAFDAGEPGRVEREARAVTRRLLAIGIPVATLCAVFAESLLFAFGPEFASGGAVAFRILLAGQVINLGTGPVGYILLMGKRERSYRNNTAIAAGIHLLLLGALLPAFGILGASIATAVALALSNLLHLRSCRRELGLATIGPVAVPARELAR